MKTVKDDSWKYAAGFFVFLFVVGALLNGCGTASGPQYPGDHDTQDLEYQADQMEQDNRQYDPGDAYTPDPPDDPYDVPPEYGSSSGSSASCDIKGNISMSGEKIYHVPGQEFYDATVIDESYGERWFCTEDEARAAGWRKAKN